MIILEPCCIFKQLNEILTELKSGGTESEANFSNGDWDITKILDFMGDRASGSSLVIVLPKINERVIVSLVKLARLTYRKTANSPIEKRLSSICVLINKEKRSVDMIKDSRLTDNSIVFAQNDVRSTVVMLLSEQKNIMIAGDIPADPVSQRKELHAVYISTNNEEIRKANSIIQSKVKRNIVKLL